MRVRSGARPAALGFALKHDIANLAGGRRQQHERHLPGVVFRPVAFEPTFHKHAKQTCGGCQIHVVDREAFCPVLTGVLLIEAFRAAGPDVFRWREPPYEYEHEKRPFDILVGSDQTRTQIEGGMKAEEISWSWTAAVAAFQRVRQRFLLYS